MRLLSWILWLLPRRVREEYRDEMIRTAAARHRHRVPAGPVTVVSFWIKEWAAAMGAVVAAWWDRRGARTTTLLSNGAGSVWFDLVTVARSLARRQLFVAAAVGTLALGIGANATVTSVAWTSLASPLPYPQSDRLVRLTHAADSDFGLSVDELEEYRSRSRTLGALGGWVLGGANLTGQDVVQRASVARVTDGFLDVLGLAPSLGSGFAAGAPRSALLSHGFWLREFGGDPAIVGRTLALDEVPYQIVGVLAPRFAFPSPDIDLFVPLAVRPASEGWRDGPFVDVVARLNDGIPMSVASAEVAGLAEGMRLREPRAYDAEPTFGGFLRPLAEGRGGDGRRLLWALLAGTGLLLLAACLNIATLVTARIDERAAELYVRRALGATTASVARLHVMEAVILGSLGALAASGVALWLGPMLHSSMGSHWSNGARHSVPALATGILAAGSIVTLVIALGPMLPALRLARRRVSERDRRNGRTLGVLAATQIALATILLSASLQLLQTVRNLTSVDLGFQGSEVVTARVALPRARFASPADQATYFSEFLERIRQHPAVEEAGLVNASPLSAVGGAGNAYVEDISADSAVEVVAMRIVDPAYATVLGVPLLAGRGFLLSDNAGAPRVAVVDEAFARSYFGDPASAIGRRIRFFFGGSEWNEIVGVVGHIKHQGPGVDARAQVYAPFLQRPTSQAHVVVRYSGETAEVASALRDIARSIDATLPLYDIVTLDQRLSAATSRERTALATFGAFAAVALLLASIGTYGLVALAERRRSREIAIRRVLGARVEITMVEIAKRGMGVVGIGVLLGLPASLVLAWSLRGLLFDVAPFNPLAIGLGAGVVVLAGMAASVLPGLSAVRRSPADLLRES